jgi:hypothetical protein
VGLLGRFFYPKKQNPSVPDIYAFRMGPIFDPGAQRAIFEDEQELPLLAVSGVGRIFKRQLQSVGGSQLFTTFTTTTQGYGGLQAGQLELESLSDDPYVGG